MLLLSWEKVARRWASWGEAARRRRGGAYDIVCCAVVGETLPGLLDARTKVLAPTYVYEGRVEVGIALTFVTLFAWLVDDSTVFETSEIEHSDAPVCSAGNEDVDAVGAEADIENLFIVGNKLCFRGKCGNIPYRTRGVDAGRNDEAG